jgi:LysM repeat protein
MSPLKRIATASAVAAAGVIGFGTAAGAHTPNIHVVQPGETLSQIAPDNWAEVAAGNGIENPHLIFPGQEIDLNKLGTPGEIPEWQPAAPSSSSRQSDDDGGERSSSSGSSGSSQAAPVAQPSSGGGTVWDRLAQCESGGNWSIDTGNGYRGGLQFSQSTWEAYGGTGNPANASREEQIRVAERVLAGQGWGAWPACSRQLGLR